MVVPSQTVRHVVLSPQRAGNGLAFPIRDVSEHAWHFRLVLHESAAYARGYAPLHPVLSGRHDVSAGTALRQGLQQHLGLLEVRRVKALGEPPIDRCQEVVGVLAFPLLLPEVSQAGGGS
jgi:hypothetical protein